MYIDAISLQRQFTQQLQQPISIQDQAAQVELFRDMFRNGSSTSSNSLAQPTTLTDRFFDRLTTMQDHHHETIVPVQQRFVDYAGVDKQTKFDGNAPPFNFEGDQMVQKLPFTNEIDFSSTDAIDSEVDIRERLEDLMTQHNDKMREVLRMQFEVGRAVVEEELLAGIAGRSTRNLDMLLRGQ